MKTITFHHQTSLATDPAQLVRQYWPGETVTRMEFYDATRGWQIAAVVQVQNRELLDQHDHELWNLLMSCDEARGQIVITVK